MANKITVKFEAQGDKALKKAINSLARAQGSLEKGQKTYASSVHLVQQRVSSNTKAHVQQAAVLNKVKGQFAVLRNSLLLYAFGYTLLQKTIGGVTKAYSEQELAEKKLHQALGKTSKSLLGQASALQQVTAFGDETIISAQSLLAAFIKDEDQLKKATVATLDLAAAKGMDLNSAADLVGKTLGSSTNSLSRYGIQVEGVVGSTKRLDTLTKNIAKTFGGQAKAQAETLSGSISQMSNAVGDTAEAIGELLAPAIIYVAGLIKSAAEGITRFVGTLNRQKEAEEAVVEVIERESQAMIALREEKEKRVAILEKELSLLKLNADEMNRFDQLTKALIESEDGLTLKEVQLHQSIIDVTIARKEEAQALEGIKSKYDELMLMKKTEASFNMSILSVQASINAESDKDLSISKARIGALSQIATISEGLAGAMSDRAAVEDLLFSLETRGTIELQNNNVAQNAKINLILELLGLQEELINQNYEKNKSDRDAVQLEKDKQNSIYKTIQVSGMAAKAMTNDAKTLKAIDFGLMMVNAFKVASNTYALLSKTLPTPIPGIVAAAEFTAASTLAYKAQQFETGGLVGGQRHSQGGTMIEAERGEFVMSRNAVESIGVNTLESMNAGGGAVNINITGNVMSSDFVEGELADKITEAVRKGVDFGIS